MLLFPIWRCKGTNSCGKQQTFGIICTKMWWIAPPAEAISPLFGEHSVWWMDGTASAKPNEFELSCLSLNRKVRFSITWRVFRITRWVLVFKWQVFTFSPFRWRCSCIIHDAKVQHWHCGSRMLGRKFFILQKNIKGAVIWSFGHLVKIENGLSKSATII